MPKPKLLPCGHPAACKGMALDGKTCGWCADLADEKVIMEHLTTIYMYMSNNVVSKPMTLPEEVIALHENYLSANFVEKPRYRMGEKLPVILGPSHGH